MHTHADRTIRRARNVSRIIGAGVGFVFGVLYGVFVLSGTPGVLTQNTTIAGAALLAAGAAGAASLALAAPLLTVEPYLWLERNLEEAPAAEVVGAVIGLIAALLIATMVAILLKPLPYGAGVLLSLGLATVLVYVGMRTGSRRRDALGVVFGRGAQVDIDEGGPAPLDGQPVIVDTSVLIDGRIVDVAAAGFVPGRLLIPGFVLEELQRVADSADPFRRQKGRRGLGVVDALQKAQDVVCELVDLDFPGPPDVDARLVKLARARNAALMTQDYNLNRLAQIEGVRVLNLNDLANAVKPIVGAGESMAITIIKEGKEPHQGVGYFEDGTMVVVENGRSHVDETVTVTVTTVLQTTAGRMIFATLADEESVKPRVLRPVRSKVAQR